MPSVFTNVGDSLAYTTDTTKVQNRHFHKTAQSVTKVAGRMVSLWGMDGNWGWGAVAPTTAAQCTRTTSGSPRQTNPTGGRKLYLRTFGYGNRSGGRAQLYDRLTHKSGFSGTSTSAQPNDVVALPRYTDGVAVRIFIEITGQIGATVRNISAAYTDTASASKTSPTIDFGGTSDREVDRLFLLPYAKGGTGVLSVESVTIGVGSTGTVGNFTVGLLRLLAGPVGGAGAWMYEAVDYGQVAGGEPEILTDACLMMGTEIGGSASASFEAAGWLGMVER